MAHMNQVNKARLAIEIAKVMPKGWKYSLSVRHHSTLVLTIQEADVDLIGENRICQLRAEGRPSHHDVNEYHIGNEYSGKLLDIFTKIKAAMMIGNHDRSEPMTDYFDVGWYIDIKIGKYERPFTYRVPQSKTRCKVAVEPTYEELKAKIAALESKVSL